jgi:histidine triad (HIT) family protein
MCIFCEIVKKKIPAEIVFEDELTICFKDIAPVAPVHLLVIPKKHIVSLRELETNDLVHVSAVFKSISKIASELCPDGFRVVNNNGEKVGQSVDHLHFHVLGGKNLGWPPC